MSVAHPVVGDAEAQPALRATVLNCKRSVEERKEPDLKLLVSALKRTSNSSAGSEPLNSVCGMNK